ncbi:MAG: ferrous iron transport protein B [Chitinophagales bacterium]|nr:ferrous iron transport protein B [Chitinophagales bacterium]
MSFSKYQVALSGNPNVGKSSVFNLLTGLHQTVGNFPGVTVDRKSGVFQLGQLGKVSIIDLPGLYSLFPSSEDEKVVVDVLMRGVNDSSIDIVGYIVDANDLERNLLLFTQIRDLGYKMVVGVNMLDTALANGLQIDLQGLSLSFGVPFVGINGRTGEGIEEFKNSLEHEIFNQATKCSYQFSDNEEQIAKDVNSIIQFDSQYIALLLAHQYKRSPLLKDTQKEFIATLIKKYSFNSIDIQLDEMMKRYQMITPLVQKSSSHIPMEMDSLTRKIDKILTHRIFGLVFFIGLMLLVFQAIFSWAEKPMEWIEGGFVGLNQIISGIVPDGWFQRLLTDGIVSGLSGVLVFIPQIAILFFLVSILEESGYMARVVYMMDSFMRRFGLNGRSVVSLISGGACAIPAIMSTRTISNWKERLTTIMVTPLISCSARIPIFAILIAIAIPAEKVGGWISLQALVFMGLYVLGTGTALIVAWVFHKILKTEERSFLVMELPRYQMPQWRGVFYNVWEKVKVFIIEAGRVIFFISILLWFMASYGPKKSMDAARKKAQQEYAVSQEISLTQLTKSYELEASYAGNAGRMIEPLIRPLGYDWKIGIALLTSFAAREIFVGTMATIYAVGDDNNTTLLKERLQEATFSGSNKKVFTVGTSISLMIFYLFAMQCMSTVAVVRRETKSLKWPAIQMLYMGVLAYVGGWIAASIF